MVTKALIFAYYKYDVMTIIETNLSNYINIVVFSQLDNNKLLYTIAFFFKNFNPIKYNYEIENKDLLAIIQCFE